LKKKKLFDKLVESIFNYFHGTYPKVAPQLEHLRCLVAKNINKVIYKKNTKINLE
jgi:hypothetical protein